MEKEVVLKNTLERLRNLSWKPWSRLPQWSLNLSSSTSYFINISFIDNDSDLSEDAVNSIIDAVIEETDKENAFPVLTDKIRRTSFASESSFHSPNQLIYTIFGFF